MRFVICVALSARDRGLPGKQSIFIPAHFVGMPACATGGCMTGRLEHHILVVENDIGMREGILMRLMMEDGVWRTGRRRRGRSRRLGNGRAP